MIKRIRTAIISAIIGLFTIAFSQKANAGFSFGAVSAVRSKARQLSNKKDDKIDSIASNVIISSNTKVLNESSLQFLSSVSTQTLVFDDSSNSSALSVISPNDIIAIGITSATPYGLLGKVESIEHIGGKSEINFSQATLTDAIQQGTIRLNQNLSFKGIAYHAAPGIQFQPQATGTGFTITISSEVVLYDADNDRQTQRDQIRLAGQILVKSSSIDLEIDIKPFRRVESLHFIQTTSVDADIKLFSQINFIDISHEISVAEIPLAPISIFIGPIPVIITPVLNINIGANGSISAGIQTGVVANASARVGLEYKQGQWHPLGETSKTFSFTSPTVFAGCAVEGYAGPEMTLLIYGVAGPYAELSSYFQLIADPLQSPWWSLYAGVEGLAGFKMDILGLADLNADMQIFDFYELLAQAQPAPAPGFVLGTGKGLVVK